jgi:hypothetical protein
MSTLRTDDKGVGWDRCRAALQGFWLRNACKAHKCFSVGVIELPQWKPMLSEHMFEHWNNTKASRPWGGEYDLLKSPVS